MINEDMKLPPLHKAAADGEVDEVNRLIADGVDKDMPDGQGDKALHYSAANAQTSTALALIKAGAKLDSRNRYDELPVDVAIKEHGKDSVIALFFNGAMEEPSKRNQRKADKLLSELV